MNAPTAPAQRAASGKAPHGLSRTDPDVARKSRDLRRMRLFATSLLALMALVFVATSFAISAWPAMAYLRAFAEAAMVGACADWFAVVALFRRPFGLPIPHTGIVPRNKQRIGDALGRFISNNFLSPSVLARRLENIDAAKYATDWLGAPGNARRVGEAASRFLPQALAALPRERLLDRVSATALRAMAVTPAAPLASRLLALIWARGETQVLLNRAVEPAELSLLGDKAFIRAKVSEKSSRFIPKWVDVLLADRLMSGIQSSLGEMKKPDHPWRLKITRAIETLIFDLANNAEMFELGEAFKRELIANPVFVAQVREVCESLEAQMSANLTMQSASVSAALESALRALGQWLREDEKLRGAINRWARRAALRALSPRRAAIGAYIAGVVANWDATTLVTRLELQVGRDLQYIRINGTLVGGLVGLIIFAFSKWLPAP